MHSETAAERGSLPAAPDKHPRIGSEVAKWPVLAGQFLLCSSIQLAWPSTTENVVQKVAGLGFCFYFVGDPDTRRGAEPGASRPRLGHSGHRLSVIHPHHTHILLTFQVPLRGKLKQEHHLKANGKTAAVPLARSKISKTQKRKPDGRVTPKSPRVGWTPEGRAEGITRDNRDHAGVLGV